MGGGRNRYEQMYRMTPGGGKRGQFLKTNVQNDEEGEEE